MQQAFQLQRYTGDANIDIHMKMAYGEAKTSGV